MCHFRHTAVGIQSGFSKIDIGLSTNRHDWHRTQLQQIKIKNYNQGNKAKKKCTA